jgi:hypothetical protein
MVSHGCWTVTLTWMIVHPIVYAFAIQFELAALAIYTSQFTSLPEKSQMQWTSSMKPNISFQGTGR